MGKLAGYYSSRYSDRYSKHHLIFGMTTGRHIYSVTELNATAKVALESSLGRIWLEAEMSNLARPASGHWYFTLKDKKAQIRCAFFKGNNRLVDFTPEDGQLLLVSGRVSLYEPRGDYQLIIDHMEPAGLGDLQRAYEECRQKLEAEGLFDAVHKQALPATPSCIGIITSPTGAAIRDVLHVLKRRYPAAAIMIYPTAVQGESAPGQIMQALEKAIERNECDVLLLTRGGGSLEDLWAFNSEPLARAIFDCPLPIVSGVGHEVDFTIADFVADVRAPTPSAAAEIMTPDQAELKALLNRHNRHLSRSVNDTLRSAIQQLAWYDKHINQFHPGRQVQHIHDKLYGLTTSLRHIMKQLIIEHQHQLAQTGQRLHSLSPGRMLSVNHEKLAGIHELMVIRISNTMERLNHRLVSQVNTLNAVSPIATLARGYSITYDDKTGNTIRKTTDVNKGDLIRTRLVEGQLVSRIESIDD